MDIAEFVLSVRQESVAAIIKIVIAFLGYITVGIGGLILVIKKHGTTDSAGRWLSRKDYLLLAALLLGALSCFMLRTRLVARRDFCTDWLAVYLAEPGVPSEADPHASSPALIKKFSKHYNDFVRGKGYPKDMMEDLVVRYGQIALCWWTILQTKPILILNFLFPLLSAIFYGRGVRLICLNRQAEGQQKAGEPQAPKS